MEITRAEIDAVFDAHGRFVFTPDPIKLDGQKNIPCDLQEGESLLAFLRRHVPGIESGAWAVKIGGAVVPQAMWAKTYPKHGMHIACRATVGKQVVKLVAVAALSYFTMGMGGMAAGSFLGLTGAAGWAAAMGAFVAGSILINKVLAPKVPKMGDGGQAAAQVFSLRSQRNSARPYEPIGLLLGVMRVAPDLANQPYTLFNGDDQILITQLLGGINVDSAHDLSIGETRLTDYQEVETYFDGFAGNPQQTPPFWGNADTVAGGELLSNTNESAGWVVRTTSVDTVRIETDIEGSLYNVNSDGSAVRTEARFTVEYKPRDGGGWQELYAYTIFSNEPKTFRYTDGKNVPKGQYDVRVKVDPATRYEAGRSQLGITLAALRSIQEDTTDYSQFGRIAIKIKATGQLSGALDTVQATLYPKPMPVWNGTSWVMATTRESGLSNPGALILLLLRGIWHEGKLQAGFGLSDEQIDIEGLKAFMLHCAAKGYTYDRWVTKSINLYDLCQEIALAGMGEFSWTDGSRPTVVFASAGQPISAVVNMASMLKASFSVDYALSNAADGIEYQYVDRNKDFETVTLRVAAPGVTTPLNPARVTGEGVTTEAHAAVMARYHLAQSLYQFKTINYGADIEHLDYRRLSVLSVSHDLTQWGYGGRVLHAKRVGGAVQIMLDEAVPPLSTPYLGLRLPGDRDYRVFSVQALAEDSDTLTLVGAWPEGVALPGEGDNPMDTLWCYDFKATPGYRVRVTSVEPEGDLKGAKVTCVPEGPEFWDYVLNGSYVPAPNQSSLQHLARPEVKNLRVTEMVHKQGNTEWYELSVVWDSAGEADHCQVWAGLDGAQLQLVDANALQNRATIRIEQSGSWLLRVVPFDKAGRAGKDAVLLYVTTQVGLAPWAPDQFVVQILEGGLRRFAWQWTGSRPATLAGVQIRYTAGSGAVVGDWERMTPLGDAADIYTAQFETTKPDAGQYVFGLRAINTSGQLSAQMRTFSINLPASLPQIQAPDLTPPPAVTGLAVTPMLATVQVSWDAPIYEMGRGHARTEIWAATVNDRAQAVKVAEGYAGPVSFSAEPATTYYVWARNVTNDGVSGEWVGPASNGATGQDPAKLLEVLEGQFDESHFKASLNQRIDSIDQGSVELGMSLIEAAGAQAVAQQQTQDEINRLAVDMLQAVLAADKALETVTDAGFYVDPVTGQVKLYGLEVEKGKVTNLEVLLDALQGQLALKATTAYVDGRIAESVLSPADLILYEGLDGRIIDVATRLDSINGVLQQKASQLELTAALVRLTSAENSLDALNGKINLRVTRAEYEADQNILQARLAGAELMLNALDIPSITATVQAANTSAKDAEQQAETLLRDILTGERTRQQADDSLAFARQELTAAIHDGDQAEAQARLQLAAQVGQQAAAVQQSLQALANENAAEALARQQLAAQMQQADTTLRAGLQTEERTRAAEGEALSGRIATAQATANNAVGAVQVEQSVRANEVGHLASLYTVRMQLSANGQAVAGGLALSGSSAGTAGPTLDFGVLANRFFVAAPQGSGIASNFQLTIQTTDVWANGVLVPAGLYVDSAYITNVNALWGRFGSLVADSIQATAISASQLTLGDGTVGGTLKSRNFVEGSSGWRLRPDGVAEFSGAIVRGTVYATAGQIGGININSNGLNAGSYWGYVWPGGTGGGFHLGPNGLLLGNPNTGKYLELSVEGNLHAPGFSIVNGVARFSGELQAASGTFRGSVVAGMLHSDNWNTYLNLAASGSNVALSIGGGRAQILADGTAYFEGPVISREMVVARSTTGNPWPYGIPIDRTWKTVASGTIDTGYVTSSWGVDGRQAIDVQAAVDGVVSLSGVSSSAYADWAVVVTGIYTKVRWHGTPTLHFDYELRMQLFNDDSSATAYVGGIAWRVVKIT